MANSRDTYHRWRFTAKRGGYTHFVKDLGQTNIFSAHSPHRLSEKNCFCISAKPCFFFNPHIVESIAKELNSFYKWKKKKPVWQQYIIVLIQGQVTCFTNTVAILVCSVRACVTVALRARQVPLLCSWAGLMRYQTQTSIHQLHWWGQWEATASVKRGIMAPCAGIGQLCLQRLLGTLGLKQYTTPATLLCSANLDLSPSGQRPWTFFFPFPFFNFDCVEQRPERKIYFWNLRPNF